jgi:hypothetical protein
MAQRPGLPSLVLIPPAARTAPTKEDNKLQARLELKRFPSILLLIVFAFAAALVLGGALGYTLKPTSVTSGPAHVIVMPDTQSVYSSSNDTCVFVGKHKAC